MAVPVRAVPACPSWEVWMDARHISGLRYAKWADPPAWEAQTTMERSPTSQGDALW